MQYNYDFHLHHRLVNASQMLGEFESFHCNRNVQNVSWYGKLNFLLTPYQIRGKEFLIVLKNFYRESRKFLLLYLLFEKSLETYVKQSR